MDRAVEAAHDAFWQWRTTPPIDRARKLMALRELLEENREELGPDRRPGTRQDHR
ncbi:MAG: aldehyde dehydrogenase family protein [Limnochordia bacterium]